MLNGKTGGGGGKPYIAQYGFQYATGGGCMKEVLIAKNSID